MESVPIVSFQLKFVLNDMKLLLEAIHELELEHKVPELSNWPSIHIFNAYFCWFTVKSFVKWCFQPLDYSSSTVINSICRRSYFDGYSPMLTPPTLYLAQSSYNNLTTVYLYEILLCADFMDVSMEDTPL